MLQDVIALWTNEKHEESHMHKNVINCPFKGIRRVTIYCKILSFLSYSVKMAFKIFI